MEGRYNIRSPAVKRLMKEAQELSEPTDQYFAQPLEDNLFEWHFTVRGPADSDFQNGIYHGRIILPVDYPMKPPSIIWLTPNGRFETNKKICLSISGHHPESWQPSWSIRTALLAIIGFMPTHPGGAIGSLDYKPEERKVLAKKSRSWKCPVCDDISGILLDVTPESEGANKEAQELAAQISFQGEKPKAKLDDVPPKEEKKGDGPLPRSDEQAALSTSPLMSSAAVSPTDSSKTITDIQTSVSASVTQDAPTAASNSSQPPPAVSTSPHTFFNTPPSSVSGLPPWSMNPPFPPPSFYSGQNVFSGASPEMPLRFPYPPSFYSTASSFYPPGCALPPGVGMFPCPFPPPHPCQPHAVTSNAPPLVSVNNSSAPGSAPRPKVQTSVSYSRTPMTSPSISVGSQAQRAEPLVEKPVTSPSPMHQIENSKEREDRSQVFDELLTKVQRVGSEEKGLELKSQVISEEEKEESEKFTEKVPCHVELNKSQSDISTGYNLRKNSCGDASASENPPSDTENSEAGVPPIEVSESEQRSILEKSSCNSTSELEKWKLKQPQLKGLRQRQSATASISADVHEEVNPSPDPSGQRIEAESGDSGPRSRPQRDQTPTVTRANRNTRWSMFGDGLRYNSSDSSTLFLMVFLFIGTVGIILNRLLKMYWAEAENVSGRPV